jgi:sugar lactone lactonase YvrE
MQLLDRRRFLIQSAGSAGLMMLGGRRAAGQEPPKAPEAYPFAIAVGVKGAIFVVDKNLKTVYRAEEGDKLAVVYKGSRKYRTPLFNVMAMAADSSGNLFFCDTGSMDVWRMESGGKLSPLTGQKIARGIGPAPADQDFDPEAAYAGKFDKPMGIAIDAHGNLVVADLGLGALFRLPPGGGEPQEIARVPAPHGIAIDRDGSIVVVSQSKDQLLRVSAAGEVTPIVKGSLAPKNNPQHVVVDQSGYVVSDNYAKAVWRVAPDGKITAIVHGEPLVKPAGLALEPDGNILVSDPGAKKLFRLTLEGNISVVTSFPVPNENS